MDMRYCKGRAAALFAQHGPMRRAAPADEKTKRRYPLPPDEKGPNMRWYRYLLVCALLLTVAWPVRAGIFGRRKKVDPAQRVPELIVILKTDRDDRKRLAAAEELRQIDPGQYPQVIPALIEALQTDPKPAVRSEAAHTLGKLRPVSQPAGQALEQAAAHDHSLRVRLQSRTALMFYHMAGYSAAKAAVPPQGPKVGPNSNEPPLAGTTPTGPPPVAGTHVGPALAGQTAEPPLAAQQTAPPAPLPNPMPTAAPSLYRPLPANPVAPTTAVPVDGPVLAPPPGT